MMAQCPDQAATTRLLSTWVDRYEAIRRVLDAFEPAFGELVGKPIDEAIWECFKGYTDSLAHYLGDREEWMDWWWMECEMGRRSRLVEVGEKKRLIESVGQLAAVVVERRDLEASLAGGRI